MICSEVDSLITDYLEDAMPQSARAHFEAHLAACRECQSHLAETRALIDASHNLGEKIRQDWRERTAGETAEQYFQRLEGKPLGEAHPARRPYRRLAPAGAAVAIVAIAAGVWIHIQNVRIAHVPVDLTIDLTQRGALRGAEQPSLPPVLLERRLLNLAIRLPIGSNPHLYQVALWRDGKILIQISGRGTFADGITTVRVQMDCHTFPKGPYLLLIRHDDSDWADYSAVIR
jgi:Putative zinc-finger